MTKRIRQANCARSQSLFTERAHGIREQGRRTSSVEASVAWLRKISELGPQLGDYASPTKIRLEVMYNQWVPFRCAWVCMLLACLCLLLNMGSGWRTFLIGGWSLALLGTAAGVVGFVLRVVISGRAPVTNMYESVVYVGLGVMLLGMLFEAVCRQTLYPRGGGRSRYGDADPGRQLSRRAGCELASAATGAP